MSDDPLLVRREKRPVIGHAITYEVCNDCWDGLPEESKPWIERASVELRAGDDAGHPFTCHKCGSELRADNTTQVAS